MIGIVDYGSGNIYAIANLHKRANIPFFISQNPKELLKADKLILPGVGAFDETMKMLNKNGLKEFLNERVLNYKTPIIGVCVGMQILGNNSEEGVEEGFGWISGSVKKIDTALLKEKPHIPHLGWNSVSIKKETGLFSEINTDRGFYFLHSYYFDCEKNQDITATTQYGREFACGINHENVFGVQFHPEKSHGNGIQLFKNFANI